jgi:predicted transcriptional regulator
MTLRLDDEMARELEVVARVRGSTVAHTIRLAVARHLANLSQDPDFQVMVDQALEDERRAVERLAGPAAGEASFATGYRI